MADIQQRREEREAREVEEAQQQRQKEGAGRSGGIILKRGLTTRKLAQDRKK